MCATSSFSVLHVVPPSSTWLAVMLPARTLVELLACICVHLSCHQASQSHLRLFTFKFPTHATVHGPVFFYFQILSSLCLFFSLDTQHSNKHFFVTFNFPYHEGQFLLFRNVVCVIGSPKYKLPAHDAFLLAKEFSFILRLFSVVFFPF